MSSVDGPFWTQVEDGEFHIVSKCGLYCDTCPAFQNGLCKGCPRLEIDDCVVRDCAHRKNVATCHDCELDSCYHFEAYAARRELMRERIKAYTRVVSGGRSGKSAGGCGGGCGAGGCGTGGCGVAPSAEAGRLNGAVTGKATPGNAAAGGCSGCASASGTGGCAAIRMIEALARIE